MISLHLGVLQELFSLVCKLNGTSVNLSVVQQLDQIRSQEIDRKNCDFFTCRYDDDLSLMSFFFMYACQIFVANSAKYGDMGHPFGYLKASSALTTVNLFVMPYNYPVLLPLLGRLLTRERGGSF